MFAKYTTLAAAMVVSFAGAAFSTTVDPTVGTFGDISLVGTTAPNSFFGGTGIPTDATNYEVFTDRLGNALLLGLSITPRFSAATPVNDNDGSFDVEPGVVSGFTGWNFSFYAELLEVVSPDLSIGDIELELLYDRDSAADTDISDLGVLDLSFFAAPDALISQGSFNLMHGFLSSPFPGVVMPGLDTFSPDFGEYSFLIRANDFTPGSMEGIGVIADAGPSPVPLPAALPLLLVALGGLGYVGRRRAQGA
ncbi:hypothetical protein A8B78_14210 [Jannaschia sp. EhC01]|nr:hypothetical protein A8B78_14210 [Jannaschia sp. EhC01]